MSQHPTRGRRLALQVVLCLLTVAVGACAPTRASLAAPGDELERYMSAVRRQTTTLEPPPPATRAARLEETNALLRDARLRVEVAPSAASQRRLAEMYARQRVFDAAYDHFTAALALDPRDAASYDGRARVWREWGLPAFGMNDVHRAMYYAPRSAAPLNTLGTLLLRLGLVADAHGAFAQALTVDADAPYALNNLCYTEVVRRDASARATCVRALAAQPESSATRTNLAMAHALAGELPDALRVMARAGSPALAPYDLGAALMALGHYPAAALAFDQAVALSPEFLVAADGAQRARALAGLAATEARP